MKRMSIGLMQGRLLPPVNGRIQAFPDGNWVEEFALAQKAGLACIERIYDVAGDAANPLDDPKGLAAILDAIQKTGVKIRSVCADYFMTETLLKGTPSERTRREEKLRDLIALCSRMGILRIILPFVDPSRLASDEETNDLVRLMQSLAPLAQSAHVELHLETDLAPGLFADLLAKIDQPAVKINYDSGNSASHGFKIEEEFSAYGTRIGSVHLKDRVLHGGTVPLGTGAVDFTALREGLRRIEYDSDFILQVARGVPRDELNWTRQNVQFARDWWDKKS